MRLVTLTVRPFVVPTTLLFSLVLLRAPLLTAEPTLLMLGLALAPFLAAIIALLMWPPKWNAGQWAFAGALYVGLLLIGTVRGTHAGAIGTSAAVFVATQIVLLVGFGALCFLRESRPHERARHLRALCWSPWVYVATNVTLHLAGFTAPEAGRSEGAQFGATMLEALGITMDRVHFPLSPGVNGFGPICAIAFATSVTLALRGEQRKTAILGALVSLWAILAIDSRSTLLFAVFAVALVYIVPRARKRGLRWFSLALPTVLIVGLGVLSSSANIGGLSREGAGDFTTGASRTVVWREAARTVIEPSIESLIGYGQSGHLTSGASVGYAYLFRGQLDPLNASAHNALLQTSLDLGWLGVPLFLMLGAVMLARFGARSADPHYSALLAATLAVLLVGIVEAAATTASPESLAWWLLVATAAMRGAATTVPPPPRSAVTQSRAGRLDLGRVGAGRSRADGHAATGRGRPLSVDRVERRNA